MKKILFLINTLGGGGAERVLVNLVNHMDRSKYDITVETMFDDGVNVSLLNKDIRYISRKAPCPRGIAYIFRLFSSEQLYKYFIGEEKYDILVAYMHGAPVKVICGCPDSNVKKIAWLHNGNPETGSFFRFWTNKKSAVKAYSLCNAVVGVSESVADNFSAYTGIDNVSVVYNTNDVERILELSAESNPFSDNGNVHLVSVGRLSSEKGYDRFYRICRNLKTDIKGFDITVVGAGPMMDELRNVIDSDNSSGWFNLVGYKENPYPYIKNADIFVCPSYSEGLSTAVTEAVILGTPCVSANVSGAQEILGSNNEFGIVTDNDDSSLMEGIRTLLTDEDLRIKYGKLSKTRAEQFDTKVTIGMAEQLFDTV